MTANTIIDLFVVKMTRFVIFLYSKTVVDQFSQNVNIKLQDYVSVERLIKQDQLIKLLVQPPSICVRLCDRHVSREGWGGWVSKKKQDFHQGDQSRVP